MGITKYLVTGGLTLGTVLGGNLVHVGTKIATKHFIKDGKSDKSKKKAKMLRKIISTGVTSTAVIGISTISGDGIRRVWTNELQSDGEEIIETSSENENNES